MELQRYGMTLYDGTIIINSIYYTNSKNDSFVFIVYFTLLHEIMHAISRLLRGNKNYLLNTDEFTKNNAIKAKESRLYFEKKFLLCIIKKPKLTSQEAKYLLDINNYQYKKVKDFHDSFKKWRESHLKEIKSSPNFSIGKTNDDNSISIKVGCYFAGTRPNYYN